MAALDDLISQIPDESLRERIRAEVKRANRQKKFGLVFEEHLPEATPLYDIPVKRGSVVATKDGQVTDIYYVEKIEDGQAACFHKATKERVVLPVDALVCVAQFGEPIYPYLQPLDTVCNAPDSDLWHTLIEADNYHALQLLEYLYAGKVDCIYIDPPYNTGARDWKYNNDYVDGNDTYRHSKWLSMMEKRLRIVKALKRGRKHELWMLKIKVFVICSVNIASMCLIISVAILGIVKTLMNSLMTFSTSSTPLRQTHATFWAQLRWLKEMNNMMLLT